MAILSSCPGLEVRILSNKEGLREHPNSEANDSSNTTTNYVEVERDGEFEIHLQITENFKSRHGICVEIRLDGHRVDKSFVRLKCLQKPEGHTFVGASSKARGKFFTSNFQFSQFVFEFNPRTQLDPATTERLRSVGIVAVLVRRIKLPSSRGRTSSRTVHRARDRSQGVSKFGRIPEGVMKDLGLSHHGSVDDEAKQRKDMRTLRAINVDGEEDKDAIAIFNFKYRSLAILHALRVAPPGLEHGVNSAQSSNLTPAPRPEQIGGNELQVSIPVRQSQVPTEVLGPQHQHVEPVTLGGVHGLSEDELVALITHYRGSSEGLAGQGRVRLQVLLEFHEISSVHPQQHRHADSIQSKDQRNAAV